MNFAFFFFFLPFWKLLCQNSMLLFQTFPPDLQLISLVRTYWVYSWVPPVGKSCGIEAALQNLWCEERLKQYWFELIAFIVLTDSRANLRLLWSKHKTVFQQVSPLIKNSTANMTPIIYPCPLLQYFNFMSMYAKKHYRFLFYFGFVPISLHTCKCIQKVQKQQQNQDLTLPILPSIVSLMLKTWSLLKHLRDLQVSDKILICKPKQLCELGDMGYELDYLISFKSLSKTIFMSMNILVISTPLPYLSSTYFLLPLDVPCLSSNRHFCCRHNFYSYGTYKSQIRKGTLKLIFRWGH